MDFEVGITSLPAETVLPEPNLSEQLILNEALLELPELARDHLFGLVASSPRCIAGWSALASLEGPTMERYAYARVGYHRGLDALRAAGWRGSGYVRSSHPGNIGFLNCLKILGTLASEIGEEDEAERCRIFLSQLDPS